MFSFPSLRRVPRSRLRTSRASAALLLAFFCALSSATQGAAQDATPERFIEFEFRPTARAQIALWIETEGGTFVDTVRLTQSVSYRGIGNRPGATLMNSGFRWPYGRREGVLPYWAHRRAAAPDAEMFPRVIFQDRSSEGFASRTSNDASADTYYCLSFDVTTTGRDALDAVTCASVFMSDKGRYVTQADTEGGYAEPWQAPPAEGGAGTMRPLSMTSLYPPRRDAIPCSSGACSDHPDLAHFADDARRVMPNIDAVTMATPPGEATTTVSFDVPEGWSDGAYVAYLEVNVEGDYNQHYNDTSYPTPDAPDGRWDYWAKAYGYPYRGQPSVVFRVPFEIGGIGSWETTDPAGYGALHGSDGALRAMEDPTPGQIANDPTGAPGSGADRLRHLTTGARFAVRSRTTNLCAVPEPPPECGRGCSANTDCGIGFVCDAGSCIGECDKAAPVPTPTGLAANVHPDEKNSHQWGLLSFVMPGSSRTLREFEVRLSTAPIVDEDTFVRAEPAVTAAIETTALVVPVDAEPGETVEVAFGGMQPQTRYHIGIRARDTCNSRGAIAAAQIETTEINFSTVSPCFIATAAYGTPYADDINVLRDFRDQYLLTHGAGRQLVRGYYAFGPYAARVIRNSPFLRWEVRMALAPVVAVANWLVTP